MENQLLKGKKGIIFGALNEQSLAWKVAQKAHQAGGSFVLSNAPIALRMGNLHQLAEETNAKIIGADATNLEELNQLFDQATEQLGGKIDFILHSIGMSPNVRKKIPYTATNYANYEKTLDISGTSLHKILQVAFEKDALNEWASVIALTYIAAQRIFPDYNDMADAKSLLESIARSFGYHYGLKKKVRINTVSQSPTRTTAGAGISGFDAFFDFASDLSPLGNAPADACADFCIALFSDLSRYVTMQNLYHDGGFSATGITPAIIEKFQKV